MVTLDIHPLLALAILGVVCYLVLRWTRPLP